MSILTNRLKIDFHIDAIERDFAFIRLERQVNSKWYSARELDYLIGKDFNAFAVMFQYGRYAYAMFKKPLDVDQLISQIRENQEFQNHAVIEVIPKAILEDSEDCICEAWLAQILINSLSSSRSRFAQYHYCNLTGALLLVRDLKGKNEDYLDVAKITLSKDYLLEVKIVRYRTKVSILTELKYTADNKRKQELSNALEKPHYILEPSTGSLRRQLPRDGEIDRKLTYIECGLKDKKASIPFLEFGNIDNFYKSRAGIFHHLIINIQKHLSQYIDVNFSLREIESNIQLTTTLLTQPKQLHSLLDGQAIHIVDRVNDQDSADLIITLKQLLLPYITDEKLITVGKRDKLNALNIRIIHDAEFYKNRGQKDEYLPSTDKFQRQNLTIESTISVSTAIVKTIIKEQLIKRDISSRKLNLFNWAKLQLKGIWTFAAWDEDTNHVIFMEIQPNGNFEFHEITEQDIFNWQKFEQYRDFMIDRKSGDKISTLEGLVISDAGDINQIFLTNEISIPDLAKIEAIINEVETELPENHRSGNALAGLIQDFMTETSRKDKDNEYLKTFSDKLRSLGSHEVNKYSFRKLMNEQLGKNSTVASELRNYLLNKHNIRLIFSKQKENIEHLFNASLNIKYFGETEKQAYYLVGDRNVRDYSFKDACHLRKIVAVNGSKLIFRQLLETMDVDFVRTGQSTVIPFPFKYIREYKNFDLAK